MWIGKSGMARRVYTGFMERLKARDPDIVCEIHSELPDEASAARVYNDFQDSKDAIVFLRSTGAKYMGQNPPKVPGFFGGCSHPEILGAVTDMATPDKNITGVTYFLPARMQLEVFKTIFPNLKSVGLLVEEGHPSSLIDQEETQKACHEMGIEYAHILEGKEVYPIIFDSNDEVLSFPPVINGILTTVTDDTKNLFLDLTGTDFKAVNLALNILSTTLADMGATIESVKVNYEKEKEIVTPNLNSEKWEVGIDYINDYIGINLSSKDMVKCFDKVLEIAPNHKLALRDRQMLIDIINRKVTSRVKTRTLKLKS